MAELPRVADLVRGNRPEVVVAGTGTAGPSRSTQAPSMANAYSNTRLPRGPLSVASG
jgi:hypothetical protein